MEFETMRRKPSTVDVRRHRAEPAAVAPVRHEVLAVVFQVRGGTLQALLWQRALPPFAGAWALPGGWLAAGETLEESLRRHLAAKVDVREVAHLEQLETLSDPARRQDERVLATAFVGLVPVDQDPLLPTDTAWHPAIAPPAMAFDHLQLVHSAVRRLRGELSGTNVGFALAPASFTISELAEVYAAALGHDVTPTNLQRVLLRRGLLEPAGAHRPPGRAGGRPAATYRFRERRLRVTDRFAPLAAPREGPAPPSTLPGAEPSSPRAPRAGREPRPRSS